MRRLFIIRKDLHLSSGKLAAMVGHCAEAYWMKMLQNGHWLLVGNTFRSEVFIDGNVFNQYINGIFTKIICEARNKNHLLKAKTIAEELGLVEDVDFGVINDKCITELTPENEDGTCTVGIWFKPLNDDIAHKISKKYQLYHD